MFYTWREKVIKPCILKKKKTKIFISIYILRKNNKMYMDKTYTLNTSYYIENQHSHGNVIKKMVKNVKMQLLVNISKK